MVGVLLLDTYDIMDIIDCYEVSFSSGCWLKSFKIHDNIKVRAKMKNVPSLW